jgi:protein-tyrosine-phosphatase
MDLKTVLVVCNGNIHRSVIAEFCLNKALEEMNLSKRLIAISRGLQGTLGTALPRG